MDFSAILAYKSLFFLNRANNTKKQAENGDKCTATANAVRCSITASQGVIPLFAVSDCLASTSQTPTIKHAAQKVAQSNLHKIVTQMTSSSTKSALSGIASVSKVLSKLGVTGNLSYAAAKCMDANEEDKTKVFMEASGNCAGMYLCENLYSKAVKNISAENISSDIGGISKLLSKNSRILKSVKPLSLIAGVGFVLASIGGCELGEKAGKSLYEFSAGNKNMQLQPAYASTDPNINTVA